MMEESADLSFIDVYTVGCQYFGFKQVLLFKVWHNGHIKFIPIVFHLQESFGDVGVEGDVKFDSQGGCALKDFLGAGIDCMRCN